MKTITQTLTIALLLTTASFSTHQARGDSDDTSYEVTFVAHHMVFLEATDDKIANDDPRVQKVVAWLAFVHGYTGLSYNEIEQITMQGESVLKKNGFTSATLVDVLGSAVNALGGSVGTEKITYRTAVTQGIQTLSHSLPRN